MKRSGPNLPPGAAGADLDKVRHTILTNGALNAKIVGQSACKIAALAGVTVPEGTKVLIGEVESVELSEEFAHEKLSPVLAMYRARDIEDAFSKAERLIADGGYGHTASLYADTQKKPEVLDAFAARMKTCRIVVNTPSSQGGIDENLPHRCQYPLFPGRHRRPVQL